MDWFSTQAAFGALERERKRERKQLKDRLEERRSGKKEEIKSMHLVMKSLSL